MIYLYNNTENTFYPTLLEGSLSGTSEYLFNLKSTSSNKDLFFVASATTATTRFDTIDLLITGDTYTYFNSIPNQAQDFYYYKVYELLSGITSAITTTELSGNTIDIATACTSSNIIEEGIIYIHQSNTLNTITSIYTANTEYTFYK